MGYERGNLFLIKNKYQLIFIEYLCNRHLTKYFTIYRLKSA